jgi:C1A family cysteine protease
MRVIAIVAVVVALASVASALFVTEREYQTEFTKFIKQYNKQYTADELFSRFDLFKSQYDKVLTHNADTTQTFQMGINALSDYTTAEFSAMKGYRPAARSGKVHVFNQTQQQPVAIDWRTKGAVTDVKNQLQCGSCWAFSATGCMEGAVQIATGTLTSLSEQQLMDCSTKEGDQSCEGGLMDNAFQFVIDNAGICAEDAYPYKAVDEKCQTTCTSVSTIKSFTDIAAGDEQSLYQASAMQPISIAIEADQAIFQGYKSGILNGKCGKNLDHGVLVVGYGYDATTKLNFWIVKNSWGADWGEKGYVRMVRGMDECGLSEAASYANA